MDTSENIVQDVIQEVVQDVIQEVVQDVEQVVVEQVEKIENVVEQVQNLVENVQNVVENKVSPQKISLIHYSSPTSLIYTVCGKVSHNLGKKTVTANKSNIISVIHDVMGAIETVDMTQILKGKQKKDLAIDCLNWFVDQQEELSQEEKTFIHDSIKLFAPDAIDVIAAVGNGVSDLVKNGLTTKMCCTIV